MPEIAITDLEVFFHIGVPDLERATPQRLLVSVTLEIDCARAAGADDIRGTIDYYRVAQDVLGFGEGRSWRLIETLADQIAALVLDRYHPLAVTVEVKKFPIPQARWVSVKLTKRQAGHAGET